MKTEFGPNNFLLETTTVTTYVHKESITQLTSPNKVKLRCQWSIAGSKNEN